MEDYSYAHDSNPQGHERHQAGSSHPQSFPLRLLGTTTPHQYEQIENNNLDDGSDSLRAAKTRPTVAVEGESRQHKAEWKPRMLQFYISLCFALTFLVLIAVLEVFDALDHKYNGFSVNDHVKTLARYLPTIVVVLLSFFWEMLVKNLKEMGPWSLMANGWTKAEDSLFRINYVDMWDVNGLFVSARKRQFGITLGYIGALLCGALVPFANNLFYTDPTPRTTTTSTGLVRTSQLALNSSFTGNGGITQNSSYFDPQSFLTYMAVNRQNYALPDWTSQNHAFESFNVSGSMADLLNSDPSINMTATTAANGFSVDTTCDPISYTFYNGSSVVGSYATQTRLLPDLDLLKKANCNIHPQDYPRLSLLTSNVSAWFNYTTCSDWQCPSALSGPYSQGPPQNCGEDESHDLRLTVNLWNPATYSGNLSTLSNSSATVSGLLCKIGFYMNQYDVEVDARTAQLLSIGSQAVSSQKLNVTNPESIVLKINQFLKVSDSVGYIAGRTGDYHFPQEVFMDDPLTDEAESDPPWYFDDGETGYFPGSVRPGSNSFMRVGLDPFILMMSSGNNARIAGYSKNMTQMASDLSDLLQGVVGQIVHTSYRQPDKSTIQGSVKVFAYVLKLRTVSLRILEAILAVLALITILSSTLLRPKTDLTADPRSLGAIGILLSRSQSLEDAVQNTSGLSEKAAMIFLKGAFVRTAVVNGRTIIEVQPDEDAKSKSGLAETAQMGVKAKPYRQTSLHWAYRSTLVLAVAAMIAGLGISWWQNHRSNGYPATNQDDVYAIIFLPATLLVLLGYATQSVDTAIQALQPYVQLSKNPQPARKGLEYTPITYSAFTLAYRSLMYNKNFVLVFSSCIRFLITAIKIVAAALFVTELRTYSTSTSLSLNNAVVSNLETYKLQSYGDFNQQGNLLRTRATTLVQFAPIDQTSFAPVGLAEGIVFSNLSNSIADSDMNSILDTGADANLRIPAVQVIPDCVTFGTKDYTVTPFHDSEDDPTIKITCKTGSQYAKCPSQTMDEAFNTSSSANDTKNIEYYWDRNFLYGDLNSFYAPPTPEQDGLNWLQNVTTYMLVKGNQGNSSASGFNVTDVASFWCNLNITAVNVNVTVNRASRAVLGGQEIQALAVKDYDASSISPIPDQKPYDISKLNFTNINTGASFRSIYDLKGKNILYNTMRMSNPNVTDDDFVKSPALLASAGGKVLAHFAAQMINLARDHVDPMTDEQAKAAVADAQVQTTRPRLVQNKGTTIVLQVLLGVVLLCIIIVVVGVHTKADITKPPNSIGAQAGLMADSELIRLVRREMLKETSGVGESDKDLWKAWDGYFVSLGWWGLQKSMPQEEDVGRGSRASSLRRYERFGIDIGEAEKRR